MVYSDFVIAAIRILPPCSKTLRKCLKEDWYYFNDRLRYDAESGKIEVIQENPSLKRFYGRNIHIGALVGVNGSGKSSLLELEYRIINNLSCILNRGKRRKASETLYFVDGLYAELYFVVEDKWGCISCQGKTIMLKLPEYPDILQLEAFPTHDQPNGTEVMMKDFIEWARSGLFYTIVTNYSMQAFLANDFIDEPVYLLDKKVISVIENLDEKNSAITGQILWSGFKTGIVYYTRKAREIGTSKWTLKKKIRLLKQK